LVVGGLFLAGCASTPKAPSPAPVPAAQAVVPPAKDAPLSKEAQEARAEALAHYATGVSYELKGEPEKALEEYFLSALADPTREDFTLDVARRLIRQKKAAQAVELLSKAAAMPGASGNIDALLGVSYAQDGKKNEALAASHKAVLKAPDQLQGYQNLFHLYLQSDQPKEALKALEDAAKVSNPDINFLVDLAELYVTYTRAKTGEIEKIKPRVVSLLEAAAKLNPENPIQRQRMAESYLAVGELQKGGEIFAKLLKQFGNQPTIRDSLRARLTEIYLRSGDRKKAAEQLEAILQNDPTNPQAYFFLAGISHDAKEFPKAAEYYEKVILLKPDMEEAYDDLALTYMAMDQAEKTIATLEKAKAKFKASFKQEFYTALAYSSLKNYAKAVRSMTSAELLAKSTEPKRLTHQFYFQMGAAHERNKDYEQAEKSFQESLRLNPDFSDALNYLGYMWAERGMKLDQALPLIEKAVKLEPDNGAYLDSLAWVLFKLGRTKEALIHINKAIEKTEKPDATLYDHLGDIYTALKQPNQARDAWRKSVSIEPNPEVQKKIEGESSSNP
jgi:tetratricopeptide (TPR) repeat protein